MLKRERHEYILDQLKENGRVIVNELTNELSVTEDTIRKDLQELSKEGLIKRVHGGALRVDASVVAFEQRIGQHPGLKEELSRLAIPLLQSGSVIYLDSGTTNLSLATQIPLDYSGTIITNSPAIALSLTNHKLINIYLLPGELNKDSKILQGGTTLQAIKDIHFDLCVLGVSSIDVDQGITVPSLEESILKKTVIQQSSQAISIITSDKIGSTSTYFVDNAKAIDIIITESSVPKTIISRLNNIGTEVITN